MTNLQSVLALADAAEACAHRKKSKPDAVAFKKRLGEELLGLERRIREGRYRPEAGIVFVTDRPKHREIHAAAFRDRVVHHLLHAVLEPRFERNFFASIHKPTLRELLLRRIEPGETLPGGVNLSALLEVVLAHEPARVAVPRGPAATFAKVPPHKRLGAQGSERGLPIGNLTSQFFANVYLDVLDQFVKRTLGVRAYVRYMDDFVLLSTSAKELRTWEARIREFLEQRLKLQAHPVARLRPVSEGCDFVGYVLRPDYVLVRRRVVVAARDRITELEKKCSPITSIKDRGLVVPGLGFLRGPLSVWPIDHRALEALRCAWASYLGHFRHANSHRLIAALWARHTVSARTFLLRGHRIKRRLALPRPVERYPAQISQLRQGNTRAVLIAEVGHHAELPVQRDAKRLGLPWERHDRRFGAGVPWPMVRLLIRRALDRGFTVAIARELPRGQSVGPLRQRPLACVLQSGRRPSNPGAAGPASGRTS